MTINVMQDVILQGNCLETLKSIADESVDCCITSPPYYGLRDYGTGEWVGGKPDCPHRRLSKFSENTATRHKQEELIGNVGDAIYKTVCPLCGAVREDKQIGLEETPEEYIERLVAVFREVKRILKPEGTLWVNIGDSYWGSGSRGYDFTGKLTEASKVQAGSKGTENLSNIPKLVGTTDTGIKNKDLIGIPWLLAFALRSDGWYLRQDIIWHKPNPMPESVKDRCTKSHEYIFLLSKSPKYYFDYEAIQEEAITGETTRDKSAEGYQADYPNGARFSEGEHVYGKDGKRNKRDVWSVIPSHYKEAHFATFPEELVTPMILAGCPKDGTVLDPFMGSGTTGAVAKLNRRHYIGCELNEAYIEMANRRIADATKIANQITFDDLLTDNQTTIDDVLAAGLTKSILNTVIVAHSTNF